MSTPTAVDEEIADVEGESAEAEADGDGIDATHLVGVDGQFERDRADEHTGAEGHDESDEPWAHRDLQGDDRPEDQGRSSDEPPQRGGQHGCDRNRSSDGADRSRVFAPVLVADRIPMPSC